MDIVIFIEINRHQVIDKNDLKGDNLVASKFVLLADCVQLCYCLSVLFVGV